MFYGIDAIIRIVCLNRMDRFFLRESKYKPKQKQQRIIWNFIFLCVKIPTESYKTFDSPKFKCRSKSTCDCFIWFDITDNATNCIVSCHKHVWTFSNIWNKFLENRNAYFDEMPAKKTERKVMSGSSFGLHVEYYMERQNAR